MFDKNFFKGGIFVGEKCDATDSEETIGKKPKKRARNSFASSNSDPEAAVQAAEKKGSKLIRTIDIEEEKKAMSDSDDEEVELGEKVEEVVTPDENKNSQIKDIITLFTSEITGLKTQVATLLD